jgi:hypothetical protein
MKFTSTRLACIALLSLVTMTPCLAESFASSASSAGSASLGSLSDSVEGSSKSSSGETKVADGDYRVIEIAELADSADPATAKPSDASDAGAGLTRSVGHPTLLQLKLQATAQAGEQGALWLTLPRQALAQHRLVAGDIVSARQRPYGVEFSRADSREAFFLVLAGDWQRELDPRAVSL